MMERSITRVDKIIKNILEYSRSKRFELQFEKVNITDIYNEIVESLSYIKGTENISWERFISDEVPFISDEACIRTITGNLVTNAIKYRRKDVLSTIRFELRTDAKKAILAVADNGEGIPKEKHQAVFDMFYRHSESAEGSGLGLYIVRQTVERLGGTIGLMSEVGVGTTFTITLPNELPAEKTE
jgi:signal transduction histidine kinase